ncbi:MAG: hypothetical protein JSS49_22930 [Planctomycetes bacterium]|nr:hypothetical protein [Planctomycetota bacterium]
MNQQVRSREFQTATDTAEFIAIHRAIHPMAQNPLIDPVPDDLAALNESAVNLNLAGADSRPTRKKSSVPPLADRFFRPVRLAKFACLVGLSVFIPYLIPHLPNLASRPEYRVETRNVRVIPAPERPVPTDLIEQTRRQNQLPRELSLLDPKLSRNLAAAFERHPWVARVISVRQSFPADVVVEVEFRKAVAMVQVKGGRIPIDGSGTILPGEDFAVSDVARFPTIRLAGTGNMARDAGRFTEPGLTGAARVAELLAPQWAHLELEAIELPGKRDARTAPADIVLQLQSKSGSTIIWGRSPGTDHPGELTSAQKVARLEKYLTEFGSFDRPSGPYEIDIRHWQEITRRPIAKAQASRRPATTR